MKSSPIIKQILIFGIVSGAISLLLACIGFGIVEFYKIQGESRARLDSQMEILSYNIQPTLLFDDADSAEKIIRALENDKSINKVILYKANGDVFANFIRDEDFGDFRLKKDIIYEDKKIGWLEIESVYLGLTERYLVYGLVSLIIVVISIPCLYFISMPLRTQVLRSVVQLVDTGDALKRSNQDLEQFAYVVSHDLKAPLRGIASLAEWLQSDYKDKLDAAGQEHLNLLLKRVRRMHHLIDAILQYSRIGRSKEEIAEVNFNELIKDVVDSLAIPPHITVSVEPDMPTLKVRRIHIEQVFQNLLSNAVKFLDKPKGEIRVTAQKDGPYWQFAINDNGPGIEEKYFEKIFKIFQTLASSENTESTGVGLAIVKKIVERAGGKIWVRSKVGVGTTFYFTLQDNFDPIIGGSDEEQETNNAG